jgi:hypothetical protein
VPRRRRHPSDAPRRRIAAVLGRPFAAFAHGPLWKKLLITTVVGGVIFGTYLFEHKRGDMQRRAAQQAAEAQRLAALETQRQAESETRRQTSLETQRQAELEAQRQAALETQRNAERAFQLRLQNATHKIRLKPDNIACKTKYTCEIFTTTVTILNSSTETLSAADFGWAFVAPTDSTCPNSFSTKKRVQVHLRPGDTATLNFDGNDGPPTVRIRYCVAVTGVEIVQ